MKCNEIQELLYDFLNDILDDSLQRRVKEHLEICHRCNDELENIKAASFFLDKFKVPDISPKFEKRLLNLIEDKTIRVGKKSALKILLEKLHVYIKLPALKISFEVLAVASVLIFAIAIYRAVTPKKAEKIPTKPVNQSSSFRGTFKANDVKNPIIIKTENIKNTFERLKVNIQSLNGKLILEESKLFEEEARVIFKIDKDKEEEFFNELTQLGEVDKQEEGYKDKEDNIVIYIFLK